MRGEMEQKFHILRWIREHPNWPTTAICMSVGVNPGLGTVYLKQLERTGLVDLIPSTRRGSHWKITDKGKRITSRFKRMQNDLAVT